MRVTGGAWRSRRLRGPAKNQQLRPTPDAMRERSFAVLGARVSGARMLDLYAGTGAVGIEALSRGAADALFVEIHRSAARLIRANLEGLAVPIHRARVLHRPVERAIAELARTNRTFDLIWADPPFESWEEGLAALVSAFDSGLTTKDTTLCLECPADADVATALPTGLVIERDLRGGASRVVMIRAR